MEFLDYEKRKNQYDIMTVIDGFRSGELKDGGHVTLKGTIYRIKEMSGFAFVNIRSSRIVFQCVWDAEKSGCDIKNFSPEESVLIDGVLVKKERSRLGFDIFIQNMTRISGRAESLPIEISNDRKVENLNLNTLLDNRVLSLRNAKTRAVFRVCDGVLYAFRTFLRGEGFTEFIPPRLVETGAEGGADMFEVDYFGRKAYLNQSPQMYKQIMTPVFSKVFTVGPVFRAEKYSTSRHINEFQGLDLEMGFLDSFYDLMKLEARMFQFIYNVLNEEYAAELELFLGKGQKLPDLTVFPTIRFTEAKELFAKAHPGDKGQQALKEPDFSPEEEKWLGVYFNKEYHTPIVFITHYPTAKRPFYTMDDPENPDYTYSYDMLLNGLEVTTGGQRIHDYETQISKMEQRGMNVDDFQDYLTMHKYGMPPHGGMGLGLERIVQNILGLDNIKLATAFPRDRDRLRP